ncbi:TonB periplasmic protein [Acetobacter malorum]|uniref:TonB periplasmic protein n=1 Tax=Acetobacter malorum TaxID=178901 RepID=A0A177GF55_9PROT|nr:TonB family protein [Acetobacter malorum]OAG78034.1 TonB periplasmic protein [Acetobacter malorum]
MKKLMVITVGLLAFCAEAKADGTAQLQQVGHQALSHNPIRMSPSELKKWQDSAVTIYADISEDGRAINCKITPNPNPDFNAEALKYCQTARYKPAMKNGVPVVEHNRKIVLRFHPDD